MNTTFFYDPVFLEHDTGDHPECAERLRRIVTHLQEKAVGGFAPEAPRRARIEDLAGVHDRVYLDRLEDTCRNGGFLDADTAVSPRSFDAALTAAGAVLDCADTLCSGDASSVFALVRPPGHHARPAAAMGFCLINNVAVAADYLKKKGLDRILIVDFDVHHGNGTQEIFYRDGSVFYLSLHRFPFYPGSGGRDENGDGKGAGKNLNVPLAFDAPPEETIRAFREALDSAAASHEPEILIVSAGFDAYLHDPVGGLGLLPEHYVAIGKAIGEAAKRCCGGKVLSALEGGYSLTGLPLCLEAYVEGLGKVQ
jgi:acetoin utilization deacetylase AcuC-like enzyme